ncbi:MAG: ABC transporter substrate-binding protein [Gammaproteobacteria bacterium]|nr:ABC transporter substrate-binding protein [Gammaproteobacteria bacterium]
MVVKSIRRLALLTITLCLSLNSYAQEAKDTISHLQDSLIELMKNSDLDYQQRFEQIAPIVDATLDIPTISKLVLGRTWRELDDMQKSNFLEKFRELSISTYAYRFSSYNNEQFEIIGQEPPNRGRVVVTSELQLQNKPSIGFEYHLSESENGWRIVNIVVDGVSDLALKRGEYNAVLSDGNFDDLTTELERQIERNSGQ